MTHPTYSQTTLDALSTAQVKDIAKSIGAIPDGDKRVKQTWISAVIDHQKVFTPAKFKAIEAHIEMVENRWESVTPAVSELPSELPIIDSYVPTPPTHADDVSFAAAMGLTYDDVFGETPEPNTQSLEPNPQSPTVLCEYFTLHSTVGAYHCPNHHHLTATIGNLKNMNNDDLKDFLIVCHVATGNLDNLVQSLARSINTTELETAHLHPDRELIKLLAEKISNLNQQIGARL